MTVHEKVGTFFPLRGGENLICHPYFEVHARSYEWALADKYVCLTPSLNEAVYQVLGDIPEGVPVDKAYDNLYSRLWIGTSRVCHSSFRLSNTRGVLVRYQWLLQTPGAARLLATGSRTLIKPTHAV